MPETLLGDLVKRSRVFLEGREVLYEKPDFPASGIEIHYDVEDDPTQDFIYLHGVVVAEEGRAVEYKGFFADAQSKEREVASQILDFFKSKPDVPIYFYSSKEKTVMKQLLEKYPELDRDVFDDIFGETGRGIDLFRWIEQHSDWPLTSYGLKSICKHLGFAWSAEDAGGANSIIWMNEYLAGDASMKRKILEYNEQDCLATLALKNYLIRQG